MHRIILVALMLLALVCLVVNGRPENVLRRNMEDEKFSIRDFANLVDRLLAKRSGCVATCIDPTGNRYSCSIFGIGSDGDTDNNPGCSARSYLYCGCSPNAQFGNCPVSSATLTVTKTRREAYPFDHDDDVEDDHEFQRRDRFIETCRNAILVGSGLTISAQCKNKKGLYQQTTLDISDFIDNKNGQMKTSCSTRRRRSALDLSSSLDDADDNDLELERRSGTILESCGGIRLIPSTMNLVASCLDKKGCWHSNIIKLNKYITNRDGKLRIECDT